MNFQIASWRNTTGPDRGDASANSEHVAQHVVPSLVAALAGVAASVFTLWIAPPTLAPIVISGAAGIMAGWALRALRPKAAIPGVIGLAVVSVGWFWTSLPSSAVQGVDALARLAALQDAIARPLPTALWIVAFAACGIGTWRLTSLRERAINAIGLAMLVALCAVAVAGSLTVQAANHPVDGLNSVAAAPQPDGTDEGLYSWVLVRMQDGQSYYPAMTAGLPAMGALDPDAYSAFNFRLPPLFYLWKVLGGHGVGRASAVALALSLAVLVLVYTVIGRLGNRYWSVLSVMLLMPLTISISSTRLFMLTETWAGIFTLLALLAWIERRKLPGGVLAAAICGFLAFSSREFAGTVLAAGLIAALVEKDRTGAALWAAALLGALGLEWHNIQSVANGGGSQSSSIDLWLGGAFDLKFLAGTLSFGSGLMLYSWIVGPTCLALAALGTWVAESRLARYVALAVLLTPVAFMWVFHTPVFNANNWGLVYTPTMFALAPLGIAKLTKWRRE